MNARNIFTELKRRNVYKVAVAYAVVGWLLIQVATQVFPFLEIPNWMIRLVILLTAFGFPVALIIAWAFELTPEGIKRTEDADAARQHSRGVVWIVVILIAAALSLGLFFLGRYTAGRGTPRQSEAATGEISHRVRGANFQDQSSHQLIGDNSRQDCCFGLGKRASAAIWDDESGIRNRVRFNASMLQLLHIL